MFRLMRPAGYPRYVDGGRVHCPRRGRDVEVDRCASCDWLTGLDLQAEPPFVRCRPEPTRAWPMPIWR